MNGCGGLRPILASIMLVLCLAAASHSIDDAKPARAIRVWVADGAADGAIAKRLKKLKFDVIAVTWDKLDPREAEPGEVIFLATHWGDEAAYPLLEKQKDALDKFIQRGGGLLASQPNRTFTPALLPYPITFENGYDAKQPDKSNLAQDHFITEDLADEDMPFPHDQMSNLDPRYRILAKQKSTDSPSLVVCNYGDGRIVVQTNNETYAAEIKIGDEILRRMIVWAAGREPRSKDKKPQIEHR